MCNLVRVMNYYVIKNIPELHLKEGNELINEGGVYVFKNNFSDISEDRTVEGSKEVVINSEYVENTPEYFEPEFVEEVIQSPINLQVIIDERDTTRNAITNLSENAELTHLYYNTINELHIKYMTLDWVLKELNYE